MSRFVCVILLSFSVLALAEAATTRPEIAPYPEPKAGQREFDPELMFQVLAGEVSAQRHQLQKAYEYTRRAAQLSGSPTLAERAAKLAVFNRDTPAAADAVAFWVQRDPNSLDARRFSLVIAVEQQKLGLAREQLTALIRLAKVQKIDGYLLAARSIGKAKQPEQVMELLREQIRKDAGNRDAWYALALLAAEFQRYASASEAIDQAMAIEPHWPQGQLLKSRILVAQDKKPQALALLQQALVKAPKDTELLMAHAQLLVKMERYQEGYDAFGKLKQPGKSTPTLDYAMGVLAIEMKRFDLAETHFQAIKEVGVHRNEAAYYLGKIAQERKEWDKALGWYRQVNRGDYLIQAVAAQAEILAGRGNLKEARRLVATLRNQRKNLAPRLYAFEAGLLRENKAPAAEVWSLYDTALMAFPQDMDLLYARALFAATQNRLDILERDLQLVLQRNPKNADALNALGYTLADQTNRYAEAGGYIEKALALKPDSPAILDSMGWLQYRLGDYAKSLSFLRQAADKVEDAEISAHLGEVLWVSGSRKEAVEIWTKATKKFSDSEVLQSTLKRLGVALKGRKP